MANEEKKDFNAMLRRDNGMPKIQIVTDQKTIEKYGGTRMYFAPPADYDRVMKAVPVGKLLTVGGIREYFARKNGADLPIPSRPASLSPSPPGQAANGRGMKPLTGAR